MQPQLRFGFGDNICGHIWDVVGGKGCNREPHCQLAPADSGQPLVINQEHSESVLQEVVTWGVDVGENVSVGVGVVVWLLGFR